MSNVWKRYLFANPVTYGGQNISRENFLLIQVFAFEFGDFAIDFAIEFRLQLNSSVLQLNSSRLQLNSGFCS